MIRGFTGTRPRPPAEYAEKGITNSGAEPDYEGVIFPDGTVVIRWQTAYRSHSVWACWADFYQVHGHPEYGTVIEFADGGPAPEPVTPSRPAFGDSRVTAWRRRHVHGSGTPELQRALDAGQVTVNAAYRAARYLSKDEQVFLLAAHCGWAFSVAVTAATQPGRASLPASGRQIAFTDGGAAPVGEAKADAK